LQFTPVHCSWINPIEQWFSILQRKRLRIADFDNLEDLEERILAFSAEWNEDAHPFAWKRSSFDKVLAKTPPRRSNVPGHRRIARTHRRGTCTELY
jgi:hypothetical protein